MPAFGKSNWPPGGIANCGLPERSLLPEEPPGRVPSRPDPHAPSPIMEPKIARILGALSVFFSLTMPVFAALLAKAAYTPLVNLVARAGGTATNPFADFFFNHFAVAIGIPLVVGVVAAALGFIAWRNETASQTETLARLLVIQTFAAFAALLWLGAFVIAAVAG